MKHYYFGKQHIIVVLAMLFSSLVYGQPAYYNGVDLSQNGANLKTALATLIQTTHTTNLSYTPGVWDALKQTDLDPTNPNKVLLIYGYNDTDSDIRNDRSRGKDQNGGAVGDWNREHVFPRSLGNPNLESSGPGSDAHHLRASDVQFNSSRGNRPFVQASGNARQVNSGWYPGDEWKGDVARMMMYMYLHYGNRCNLNTVGSGANTYSPEIPDIFLQWNAEDPVTPFETNRNNILEGIQGNRNPFIDNPSFATDIWGGPQAQDLFDGSSPGDTQAPTAAANLVASNISENALSLSWDAATDNVGVTAYRIFQNGTQMATSVTTTYNVSGLTANTIYNFKVVAVDAAGNTSPDSNVLNVTTLEASTPPAGDAIVLQNFEGDAKDTWSYTATPDQCTSGSDVWNVVSSVGNISAAAKGTKFFGIRDLLGDCNPVANGSLNFTAADISGHENVTLTFAVNIYGFDNGDVAGYELTYDGVAQPAVDLTAGARPFSTNGWETVTVNVPANVSSIALKLTASQNGGSDYAGFDNIKLAGDPKSNTPDLVINEIDPNTPGTDVAEFVELYDGGAGNSSLDGFVLVFYNGSDDKSYAAYDLDGQTTNADGYFVIGNTGVNGATMNFASNGLQNGTDAVALFQGDASDFPNDTALTTDNLVDAVVYGYSNDAALMVLLNAGQNRLEDVANESLQRIPNGQGGTRNTAPFQLLTPTPGAANQAAVVVPDVVINEFDADQSGTDTAEFVELYDGGAGNSSLDGFVLVMYNGSNDTSYAAYDLDGQTTNADGYFVIGNTGVNGATMTLPSNGLQNGADAFGLYRADATDFPNGTALTTDNLIDAVVYGTNDSTDTGLLALLNAGEAQLNDTSAESLQRIPNGQGGTRNTAPFQLLTPTPGAANQAAVVVPAVVINEFDADQSGTDTAEFVELYDGGTGNSSLDGFVLVMYNGSNDTSYAA
ncbi:MAG: endonuclease, partial [Flavobacteriaceae bacterium]|nr:endonuclease [Flavobacteriaceae bacterium]